jgi:hypothetical protein
MDLQIIGYVAMYLLIGAIINGIGRVDPEESGYYGVLILWPLVLVLVVLIAISTVISGIVKALIKGTKK